MALLAIVALAAGCARPPATPDPDRFARFGETPCVHDRISGLLWETRLTGDPLHEPAHTFSWYSPDRASNMSDPGVTNGGSCALERCDTTALVEAVNEAGLCGYHDWRLPTHTEALSLALTRTTEHGHVSDAAHFVDMIPGEYWTATTFRLYPQAAWAWDARNGLERADWKSEAKPVRLVRGPIGED